MTTTDKDFVVKNGLVVQGAQGTIDNSVIITEAALDISLGDYIALLEKGAADGVAELDANSNVKTISAIVFEGATDDAYELTIGLAADPTVDRTITIPDVTGTILTTGNPNDAYPLQSGQSGKYLKTDGTNVSWDTVSAGSISTLTIGTGLSGTSFNGTAPVTISIDSTVATTSSSQTLTNKTISGSANTISNISLTSGVTGTLPIGNGGTNITTYTTGDILYASATNTLSKLGAGTEGHVLTISSGVPAWQASSSDPIPQIFLLMGA